MIFKKGAFAIMHNCGEATFPKNKDVVWKCQGDSFLSTSGDEVVFLKGYSGYFLCEYLEKPTRDQRLNFWLKDLTDAKKTEMLVELLNMAIDSEDVKFWDDTVVPYWDGNGDQLDGSEREDNED